MELKLKIHGKLLLYILSTAFLIYATLFAYILYVMRSDSEKNSIKLTQEIAEKYASIVESELNADFAVTKTLKNSLVEYPNLKEEIRDTIFKPILKQIVMDNSEYMAAWYSWEMQAIYDDYQKPYGRISTIYFRQGRISGYNIDKLDMQGDSLGSTYYKLKINPQEVLVNPYYYNYTGDDDDNELMATIVIPLYKHHKFAGLAGLDISLNRFNLITEKIKPYEDAMSFIVANNGNFVAFSNKDFVNKPVSDYFLTSENKFDLQKNINEGIATSFITTKNGKKYYVSILPLNIGNSATPWAIGIMTPIDRIMKQVQRSTLILIGVSSLGLLIMIYVIWIFSKRITNPLKKTTEVINDMAKGNITDSHKLQIKAHDEISDIRKSVNILIDNLNKTAEFAIEIGKGNLDYDYKPLSSEDILGNSLLDMRLSLKNAQIEELKRKEADDKLNWATSGAAKFAEILRMHSDNQENLAYAIISELVKYIDANQGGLFIVAQEDEDNENSERYVELLASYAFERRKMITKKIPFGVGLVGRALLEKETIYMNKIPKEYVNITSGLGEENPSHLLIVPLIFNNEIFGAVEIASFKKIEKYQIEFVETVGESIASAISMVQINTRTSKLLESTRLKSEEMASQEEEMRQNIEEMKSSREELTEKLEELQNIFETYKSISYIVEYDINGKITDISNNFVKLLGRTKEDFIGKYQGSFSSKAQSIEEFNILWDHLRLGKTKTFTQEMEINGEKVIMESTFAPVKNSEGVIYKVVDISRIVKKLK